jgi:hypothetical protein
MNSDRDNGPQPLIDIMAAHDLSVHDLVVASPVQMTHKQITRACKGRRLTQRSKLKVKNTLNAATDKEYTLSDIFNY